MSSSTLTLIGLYNYDPDLFINLSFPEGIDKSTFIDNLLLRSGEFEVMYPDADFLKFAIGAWSRKWQPTFVRWVEALSLEYDPIENYNRYEDWTDNRDIDASDTRTENNSSSGNTAGRTNSNTTNQVSAYDGGDNLTNHDKSLLVGADSSTTTSTLHISEAQGHITADDLVHSGRIHGNIGVTTSQQMLLSELDLGYWNLYNKCIDLFITEFVIPVY